MNTQDADLNAIRELNLSYLVLAQRLLRANFARGMYRLGLREDAAQILNDFTLHQLVKLASCNVLLCSFRLNDYELLSSLNREGLGGSLLASHATLLLASERSTARAAHQDGINARV